MQPLGCQCLLLPLAINIVCTNSVSVDLTAAVAGKFNEAARR
jgi:hypothetical protein